MATPPSLAAIGAAALATSGTLTVNWPAHVAGQVGILQIVTENSGLSAVAITVSPTSGWTALSNGNQVVGTSTSGCRMQIYRKIASSSSEPAASISINGNTSIYGKIFTFDGCTTTSSPVPVSAGSVQPTPSTTVTYPAVTTFVDNCLVVCLTAHSVNNNSMLGSMVNASLTTIIKHQTFNSSFITSAILSGIKLTAGSVVSGSSLWTATASSHVSVTAVLAPIPDPIPAATSPQLDITPVRDGYSVNIQNSCIEIEVAGGPIRKRQDVLYAPHIVTANWLIHKDEYSAFMGFFRTGLNGGEEAFLLDLITDIGIPTTHRCRTMGGIPRLTKQTGELYYASCTLEAEQNPTFTGLIEYREPNFIVFFMPVPGPYMEDSFSPGDVIQIIDSSGIHSGSGTHLNLDGTYVVESNVSQHAISLVLPTAVNSDWTVLAGLGSPGHYGDGGTDGSVLSTITRVPT